MEGPRYDHPYYGRPDYGRPGSTGEQERLFSADYKRSRGVTNGFVIVAIQFGLPFSLGWVARIGGGPAQHRTAIYLAGFIVTIGAYLVSSNLLPVHGYSSLKQRFAARMHAQGMNVEKLNGIWVGFSPDGEPRVYENNYDWDVGFLFVMPDRLCFVGDQARFALRKDQVIKVRIGSGGPSWWGLRRVYIDWRDDSSVIQSLNFRPADARSMRRIGPLAARLFDRLSRWRVSPSGPGATPPELAALGAPSFGTIPSQSLAQVTSGGRLIALAASTLILSALLCFMTRLPFDAAGRVHTLYVLGVAMAVWVLQALPYIAFRRSVS